MSECGFCKGKPVWNAASWFADMSVNALAACPRCGETNYPKETVTMAVEEQEREYPPTWEGAGKDPQPGTTLKGVLKDVRIAQSDYGEFYVADVEGPDGIVSVPAYRTVLKNQLDEAQPQVGEEITIEYVGRQQAASGRTYHDYRVNGGGRKGPRRPAWLQNAQSAEPPIVASTLPVEATPQVMPATDEADEDDDDDIPF